MYVSYIICILTMYPFQAEMIKFLKKSNESVEGSFKRDKFDHFGEFIAAELRSKSEEQAVMYITTTNLVMSDLEAA